ncbi:unnamed protein product [Ectocarpus sp. CCAP 1310/34]|nr:unnamed protein product [Ectocarpus sp. CCAP 1310/34]
MEKLRFPSAAFVRGARAYVCNRYPVVLPDTAAVVGMAWIRVCRGSTAAAARPYLQNTS